MGSDAIALPMLRHLRNERPAGIDLLSVFTQPDRKSGRGMRLTPNAIKQWAEDEGLGVLQPGKCGAEEADYLSREKVDLVVVMAYGQILPRCILEACPMGVLNLHASLLPRLRGASPIHTSIAIGLKETGVSLMRIVAKLDAGPVADREIVSITGDDTTRDIFGKLSQACIPLMSRSLPSLKDNSLVFEEQDSEEVTYCRIIDKTDAHLDFNNPAEELVNRVRAFQPWPGTSFPYDGQEIRILAAKVLDTANSDIEVGSLFRESDGSLCIACSQGSLNLLQLQRPGGKPLQTDAFLRGFHLKEGSIIESREMRPLEDRKAFPYRRK